jgi:uncharacterized protein (TIGR00369 family)
MLERNLHVLKGLGSRNLIGLSLEFKLDGNMARTEFVLNEEHQGPDGYIHDGIIAFLMDVAMGWIARHAAGVNSVTATLGIDYHKQARSGEPLVMTARITKNTKRLLEEAVRIESKERGLIAEGTCVQYIMGLNQDVHKTI